jgi:C1A family cysteine protease
MEICLGHAAVRPGRITLLERAGKFGQDTYLAMGIPSVFGFYGFETGHWEGGSYLAPYNSGEVAYPCPDQRALWGHAVLAVGYDNNKKITNARCGKETTGALLIRNSWGTSWGEAGYG